jgi:hypothetical protein
MPKTIYVTSAQVAAAKLILKRAKRGIGEASPAVIAIANAKPRRRTDETEASRAAV